MDITRETTIGEAAPFLKGEHLQQLLDDPRVTSIMGVSVFDMTVGEFLEAMEDDYAYKKFFYDPDANLIEAVGKLKNFRKQMEDVQKLLKMNEPKLSSEETQAQAGVVFPSFEESMLCDCIEWFHLRSMDEAEALPFSDYLVMQRRKNAEALYNRNLNKVYAAKAQRKK